MNLYIAVILKRIFLNIYFPDNSLIIDYDIIKKKLVTYKPKPEAVRK